MYTRRVKTYIVRKRYIEDEDVEDYEDDYQLLEGPWFHNVRCAELIIAVPRPFSGVLAVGDKNIAYCNEHRVVELEFNHGLKHDSARNRVHGCTGLDYTFGDIVYGILGLNGPRYLFPDQNGQLRMLVLTRDQNGTELKLLSLGKTSIASTISYLRNDFVYVGSKFGDSQLIMLNLQPGGLYNSFEVLETYINMGPVSDFVVADLKRQGQGQLVTCSGCSRDGSLWILRKESQLNVMASMELCGIESMWSLRLAKDDQYDSFLVISQFGQTYVSSVSSEDESMLVDTVIPGFSSTDTTLLCHNVLGSLVLQVTSFSGRLVHLITRKLLDVWEPPDKCNVILAAASSTQVLMATQRGHLYYLEIVDEGIVVKSEFNMEHEIVCLDIGAIGDHATQTEYAVVSTWDLEDKSFILLSLPKLTVLAKEKLDDEFWSCCVLLCSLEGISYLFCATVDGSVVYYIVDTSTKTLTHRKVVSLTTRHRKVVSLTTRPIMLKLFSDDNTRHVFVVSDKPTIIYSSSQNLHFGCVDHTEINQICSFRTLALPNCFAIATEDKLTLETLYEMKTHTRSVPLHEQALCISHQTESHTFTVACAKSTDISETSHIHLLDDLTFKIIDTYPLLPRFLREGEMSYGGCMLSCKFIGDNQEYICVGTASQLSCNRGILVFIVRDRKLKLVSELKLRDGHQLFCMNAFNGMLLVGIGQQYQIYEWLLCDDGTRKLQNVCQHSTQEYATCVQSFGDYIFCGTGRAMQLMSFKAQGKCNIESLDSYVSGSLVKAVDVISDNVYLGATTKHDLITLSRSEGTADEEGCLEVVGQYQLGEQVSRFCHGSLVSACQIPTFLFSTISGGIGLIASLPRERYELLDQLQSRLRESINQTEEGWRLYHHNIQPADLSDILDGDLIKMFFDWDIRDKERISRDLSSSMEELEKKIKEVTHLY